MALIHDYQTEVGYYRDLLRDYARRHPEVASMVLEGSDAAVERLLQGAALLSARLRNRVDDDFPEIIGPFFEHCWRSYLRPVPATTILAFNPRSGSITKPYLVASGSSARVDLKASGSRPARSCYFRTTVPMMIVPFHIVDVSLEATRAAQWRLTIRFEARGSGDLAFRSLASLRIHLLGDDVTRFTLYYWLCYRLRSVEIADEDGVALTLGPSNVQPLGSPPTPRKPFHTLRLLEDYFHCCEQFIGIELAGFDQLPLTFKGRSASLSFRFDPRRRQRAPGAGEYLDIRPTLNNFALNCVPAVNISEPYKMEIPTKAEEHIYMLKPPSGQIVDIQSVSGMYSQKNNWIEYVDFYRPLEGEVDQKAPRYYIERRADSVRGVYVRLVICDIHGHPLAPESDRIRILLTHSDGELPAHLAPGTVTQPGPSAPGVAEISNRTPVVPARVLDVSGERFWRIFALLELKDSDLASANGLMRLIRQARGGISSRDEPLIHRVESTVGGRLYRQTVVPVRRTLIEMGTNAFSCEGEFFCFANLLQQLFVRRGSGMVFHEVRVRAMPSAVDYCFETE